MFLAYEYMSVVLEETFRTKFTDAQIADVLKERKLQPNEKEARQTWGYMWMRRTVAYRTTFWH
jgi:hypothetical protein